VGEAERFPFYRVKARITCAKMRVVFATAIFMSNLQPHALAQLSLTESSRRAELEQVIARGLATFVTVGNSLLEIRDSRLYRDTHATFEDYCVERWKFARNYANKLIAAAGVTLNLGTIVPTPTHESQVRPLAGLEPEQQREAWDAAVKSAPNGKVTAAHVSRVAEGIKAGRPSPSAAALTKATNRILAVCGKVFQAEVRGRLTPEESVQLSKLTDAEMLKVKTLMLRGWVFRDALQDVMDELTPGDEIRGLHTRAVQAGGRLKTTVAGFVHVVVTEDQAQDLVARLKGW
jgi:predicted lipoprotein